MIEISESLRRALESRPVLAQGQEHDLVIEVPPPLALRVWLSRVDGTVSVERQKFSGAWLDLDDYEAEHEALQAALLETMGAEWEKGLW